MKYFIVLSRIYCEGDSALLSLQVSQVFKITRELLYHVANMLAPCPSRLFAALAKQNKRFVCSRKHVERRPRGGKKSAIPFTKFLERTMKYFMSEQRGRVF